MSGRGESYVGSLQRLHGKMADVLAELLRRALKKRGYRGLEDLDLAKIIADRGVRGARRAARYYHNLLRESRMPGLLEFALALYARQACKKRWRAKGWLRSAAQAR